MKVLIVSTSDIRGGAARAALRLHQGLKSIHLDCQMLVQSKESSEPGVIGQSYASGIGQAKTGLRLTLDRLPLKFFKDYSGGIFSSQWQPDQLARQIRALDPDVINLHWTQSGFLQIETLAKLGKPIVWTLHDMWAFTGGCHYDDGCDRYQNSCGICPQLGSRKDYDLSRWIWRRKAKTFKGIDMTIVSPSRWLGECAKNSTLFKHTRVEVIPNGIDTQVYRPMDKQTAREALRLPQDKQLILFGSLNATSDKRKGFHLLQAALKQLSHSDFDHAPELVIFGDREPNNPPDFGFKVHYLGSFSDDLSLAFVYSAADVFVLPSVQENLANTIMEALACATPCIAFDIGGMPDMLEHQSNGYLAKPFNIDDLAQGISSVLKSQSYPSLSEHSRKTVLDKFSLETQAKNYASLFSEISD
jgi:glycosyltransferase involved in cell wall biosynthesis